MPLTAMKGCEDQRQLHLNAYRHFRQEFKREIRLAEKEHVRSEILKSSGKTPGGGVLPNMGYIGMCGPKG